MRKNYVLIDFENVQPEGLAALQQDHFKVLIFVGANQAKVPFEVASALQSLGSRAEYIKISGNGANALDFHIAFYIGQLAAADPTAYFHIISGDKGFDPLIEHMKDKNIFAAREKNITEIPLVKVLNTKTPHDRAKLLLDKLRAQPGNIPTTIKGFTSIIKKTLLDTIGEEEVKSVIAFMEEKKDISVKGAKLTFNLDK